ncbi:hypothetical protein M409DRAFT_61362 [Zasmidium cellare ATCC 36951]|uniref:Uncharacterized protein n=1 Tax=Zasmidium cellare ATCC 36951 TaxID=1080233 RepID=A0A6A6BVE6_ZASCE|nr:uncharacterized protein M409DRAFT_61362 [Zasmidium cellare ATCC 36951]KAF2158774.1 hypothetical protein M409DRAFT_61362 [Zasmidium cellare ATCC 36951]
MPDYGWLLENLEKKRQAFACEEIFLPSRLKDFQHWHGILCEDQKTLQQRSSAARSVRTRARDTLENVYNIFGLDLFVLFTHAASMTKLVSVNFSDMLPDLKQWWTDVPHPQSLKDLAAALDKAYNVAVLVTRANQADSHDIATKDLHAKTLKRKHSGAENIYGAVQTVHRTTSDTALTSPGPVLDFKLSDLLTFLEQHGVGDVDLRMRCTYAGHPLPFIDINEGPTIGLSGKLEFSLQLSEALLKFVLPSRFGPAEISDRGSPK